MMLINYVLIFCIICCWAPSAIAAPPPVVDDNIHINADRMSQNLADGIYIAEGNVVVSSQGMNLVADSVIYEVATHILNATGAVVLSKGTTVLKGETLVLNMDTGRAEMDPALLTIPKSGMMTNSSAKQIDQGLLTAPESDMTLTAAKIVRINENEYSATSSELTSCDMPYPSWKFGANKLDVDLQGYARGRHVIFYIKDIPILYLPWMAFPVAMEKRSGLLFPRLGHSKSRGMQLDIPVYWVISPSQDLQLDLDIMSRRGVGTGVDYRYIRKRGSEGYISVYSIYDQVEDRWRWQLAQEHKEIFSNSANLRMSVNTTGDRTFLNDFGEKSGDYNRQSSDTIINTLKTWQNYAATSYLRYNENLYAADNRTTVQTLPSIGVAAVRQSIFTLPLYFDLDGTADNLYRETAPAGQRLYLFPRITLLPFQSKYFQVSLFAGAHIRGYATEKRLVGSNVQATDGDLVPEAGLRLSTSLTRIYEANTLSLKKIRHEIIPEISYSFESGRDQERLPLYDYTDRLIQKNLVSLSVTSLMNGKFVSGETTEYRDISRIKLAADYKMDGERRDLLTLVESQHPWSDLMLETETSLTKQLRITFNARYNLYGKDLSTAVTGFEFDDKLGNSIGAAYQMARNEVEYFEGRFATRLIKPLNLSYTARYSFDRGDFLESVYAAEYRHKCWSLNLAVHQRPGNQSYTVNFNLAGLGSK